MKQHLKIFITAVGMVAALALPSVSPAQEQKKEHHHYKVVDLGTLGGPQSFLNEGGAPNYPASSLLTRSGAVAGISDTSAPDPFNPLCYGPDCDVMYAFRWRDGVQTNLGVLPQNPATGAQAPCLDCAWSSWAFWISDNGLVAGESENNAIDSLVGAPSSLAVLWKDGKIINLGTLGGNESVAGAVNNRGEVVGAALNAISDPYPGRYPDSEYFIFGNGTESHAFLWRGGTMQDLGTLGGPDSAAFLVNERGQVAGASDVDFASNVVTGGPTVHPFLWQHGKMIDLVAHAPEGMFGGTYGSVSALNDGGQLAGTMNLTGDLTWHSFLWDGGKLTDLGTLGGAITTAIGMNNSGHIVGRSDVTALCESCPAGDQKQLHRPFFWKDGVITDVGVITGDNAGSAYSVNSSDQVVGRSTLCSKVNPDDSCEGASYHAFLWENGSMADLQTLILPGSGFTVNNAVNINDRGEIAGYGTISNGDNHVILLIPCDGNRPGVEGCDYSMVDAATAAKNAAPRYVPSGMQHPPQSRWSNRYQMPGLQSPSR
jgi:probable HAF family extracellular repeat protein